MIMYKLRWMLAENLIVLGLKLVPNEQVRLTLMSKVIETCETILEEPNGN